MYYYTDPFPLKNLPCHPFGIQIGIIFIKLLVMDNIDMFQARLVKVDEFGWWDMEIIQTDAGTQFTFNQFQECILINLM